MYLPRLSFQPARSPEQLCFGVKNTMLHSNYLGSFGSLVFPSLLCHPAEFISPAISVSFYCWLVVLLKLVFTQFNANQIAGQRVSWKMRQRLEPKSCSFKKINNNDNNNFCKDLSKILVKGTATWSQLWFIKAQLRYSYGFVYPISSHSTNLCFFYPLTEREKSLLCYFLTVN